MQASIRNPTNFRAQPPYDGERVVPAGPEWEAYFEQGAQPLTDHLLALAGVAKDRQVLSLAAGLGEPAFSAARLVGQGGRVVGIDRSGDVLAVARERAGRLGFSNLTFLEQGLENLDFPPDSFDSTICRWGLMFVDDLVGTLQRVRGLLRPGGRLAAAVWAASPKVPLISLPVAVIAQRLRLPSRPGDLSFNLSNRHALALVLGQAGFVNIQSETITITVAFPDAGTYIRYLQAVSPYLAGLLAPLPPDRQDDLWAAVGEATRQRYAGPDGMLRIPGEAICIAGQKPWRGSLSSQFSPNPG